MLKSKNYSGFTLIEVMIVLSIVAILAAICIPSYMKARKQAKLQACCANLITVATAINMMETEQGKYCASLKKNEYGPLPKTELGRKLIAEGFLKKYAECPDSLTCYSIEAVNPTSSIAAENSGIAQKGAWKLWCTDKTHGHNQAPHYYSWCGLVVK